MRRRKDYIKQTLFNVKLIRKLYRAGFTQAAIGRAFDAHQTNISHIVRRKTWRECA